MAFAGLQTRRSQTNQNVQRLLQYLMESDLMKQRQTGYMELESAENENMKKRAWDTWMYTISRDPEIQRTQSEIFIKRNRGYNTAPAEELLKSTIATKARSALSTVQGTPSAADIANVLSLSDETARALLSQSGASMRQTQNIMEVERPNIAARIGELGVAGENVEIRRAELIQKRLEEGKKLSDTTKAQISFAQDVAKYLIGMGVQGSDTKQLMQDFTAGKAVNPLSPQNQGMALQWLGEIELKLAEGGTLTPAEKRFMATTRNVYRVEGAPGYEIPSGKGKGPEIIPPGTGAGLVSPTTGMTGGEEAQVNPAIEQKVNQNMLQLLIDGFKKRGFNDVQALQLAQDLMSQLK